MRSALQHDGRFSTPEVCCYDWDQTYSAAEYRQLMLSYSGTQTINPRPARASWTTWRRSPANSSPTK